jgi:hypothetical protein
VCVADNVASASEEQIEMSAQFPCSAEIEREIRVRSAFARRVAEQLDTKRQPVIDFTFGTRLRSVIARFGSGAPQSLRCRKASIYPSFSARQAATRMRPGSPV